MARFFGFVGVGVFVSYRSWRSLEVTMRSCASQAQARRLVRRSTRMRENRGAQSGYPSRKSAQLLPFFWEDVFFLSEHQVILWNLWNLFQFLENWLTYGPKWWVFPRKYYRNNELCFVFLAPETTGWANRELDWFFFGNQKRCALKPCECVQNLASGVVFSLEFPGRKYLDDFRDQIWKDEQIWTAWRSMMTRVISSWFHVL